jgi:hypothetical protein
MARNLSRARGINDAASLVLGQQRERNRRIGVILGLAESDPQGQLNVKALLKGLRESVHDTPARRKRNKCCSVAAHFC